MPVSLPVFRSANADFRPIHPQQVARSEGRETASVEEYARWWTAQYNITPVSNDEAWRLARFLSSRAPFVATHPLKLRPLAYLDAPLSGTKAIGGAFDGSAVINDLSDRSAPIITGLPADFQFTEGDLVEFRQSVTVRSLHMVKADTPGDQDGIVTLPLDYPVPLEVTASATVHLEKPGCVMKIMSDSQGLQPVVSTGFGFEAQEVFLP